MTMSKEIIVLAKNGETLKRIERTGWALAGVGCARQESVGEHTFGTALIASLIAKAKINQGDEVDLAKVVMMTIIHDLVESMTSDIPRTATELGGVKFNEGKIEAEKRAIRMISKKSEHYGDWFVALWEEMIEKDSVESRIVYGADVIDMLVHAISLESSGVSPEILNQFFVSSKEILKGLNLKIVEDIFRDLYEEHSANAERLSFDTKRITRS